MRGLSKGKSPWFAVLRLLWLFNERSTIRKGGKKKEILPEKDFSHRDILDRCVFFIEFFSGMDFWCLISMLDMRNAE